MNRLIEEIRAALQANMFTLALQGSLALIDICAALESEDGRTRASKFKAWYTAHLGASFSRLTADDAYQLRCGLLHQGRASSDQYDAVIFALPIGMDLRLSVAVDRALVQDLPSFVESILDCVEAWWEDQQGVEPVRTNSESLVRLRPEGLESYIVGVPVLA